MHHRHSCKQVWALDSGSVEATGGQIVGLGCAVSTRGLGSHGQLPALENPSPPQPLPRNPLKFASQAISTQVALRKHPVTLAFGAAPPATDPPPSSLLTVPRPHRRALELVILCALSSTGWLVAASFFGEREAARVSRAFPVGPGGISAPPKCGAEAQSDDQEVSK